ncbi:MAG: DUF1800 domain-containing protein [Chloroflexota bacterium]|nr:DUF1800 domain-containing protein [Chloroflexota bacterium]
MRIFGVTVDDKSEQPSQPAQPAQPGVLNRRTVLASAAAAGLGVAAARLIAYANEPQFTPVPLTGTQGNKTGLDWVAPLGNEAARVSHLLRRFTFGATAEELERAQSDGYARTVDRLLETKLAEPPVLAGADEASQEKPLNPGALQQWWIDWMLASPTPFAERMTLFWHGHFTSDFRKVGNQFPFLYWQNLTWRRNALADLKTLLYQVTIDPAMLRYLDLGNSTARNPNENYSRELMELFTMGPDAFTEDDVRAGATALSGWREPQTQAMIDANLKRAEMRGQTLRNTPKADTVKTGVFEPQRGYRGAPLTFLGETKPWSTDAVLDKILQQDATGPFIVRKLLTHFVTPTPSDAYVARLAGGYRKSRYDTKALLRDIFISPEFIAADTYRALIKSPTELMVHTAKVLGDKTLVRLIAGQGQGMGQMLFDPPSVGGWPENESWVSSNNMLARANFVTSAVQAVKRLPSAVNAHNTQIDGVMSAQTLKLLNEAMDDRRRWSILLASPEFQLK